MAGMFMDVPMALALLVPLFGSRAAVAQGVHPIHLGIIRCLNLTLGLVTPPLGGCLIVVSAISGETTGNWPGRPFRLLWLKLWSCWSLPGPVHIAFFTACLGIFINILKGDLP